MAFLHLSRPKATVSLTDGQSFTVSGLSPNHVLGLYHRHRGQLSGLFDRAVASGEVDMANIRGMAESLFGEAPLLLAEIIAVAGGSNPFVEVPVDAEVPEGATLWQADLAFVADLSLPTQIDALQKIGELTFTPDMPPKKFMSALVAMMQGAQGSLPPSANGSGDSAVK